MGVRRNWFLAILFIFICAMSADAATISNGGIIPKDQGNPLGPAHSVDCVGDGINCTSTSGTMTINVDQAAAPAANYYVAGHNSELELIGSGGETGDACIYGNCLNFDGTNDYVVTTDYAGFETAGDLSVAAWIYPTLDQTGVIVSKGASATQWRFRITTTGAGVVRLTFVGNGATFTSNSTIDIPLNKWSHVAVTLRELGGGTSDRIRMYVNGELVYSDTAVNWGMPADASALRIGSNDGLGEYFAGRMDTVAVFATELPAWRIARMASNYGYADLCSTSQEPGYGYLVNCWTFDEASGVSAAATEGAGYAAQNGTLTNMASPATGQSGWAREYREDMFVNCKLSGCIAFDGIDDYVSVADHADLEPTVDMSFAMWVNPSTYTTETTDATGTLIGKGTQYSLSLVQNTANDGKLGIQLKNNTAISSQVLNGNFETGTLSSWTAGSGWTTSTALSGCVNCNTYVAYQYNNNSASTQTVAVVTGVEHTLYGKIFLDATPDGTGYIRVDGSGAAGCTITATQGSWVDSSCVFTPTSSPITVRVNCFTATSGDTNECKADNISISQPSAQGITLTTTESPVSVYTDTHIAVTVDNTAGATDTIKMYVNGALHQTWLNQNWTMPAGAGVLSLGADIVNGFYYKGRLDDVRIYKDYELSAGDVTAIYNAGAGTECTGNETGTGIVGCWKFNIQTGNAIDTTGSVNVTSNDGTLTNMGPYKADSGWNGCQFGTTCIHLDGNNDYYTVPWQTPEINPTTAWTIEAWVYREQVNANFAQRIISKQTANAGYALSISTADKLVGSVFTSTGEKTCTSTASISVGVWTHVAVEFSGTTISCYINGSQDGTNASATGTAAASTNELRVGGRDGISGWLLFPGRIQEVRIWNAARGATDINAKKSTACDTAWTNLKACWPMTDQDRLMAQAVDQTGVGDDTKDCLSEANACKTIQVALSKIPHYYSGSTTLHLASGWHAPATMVGYIKAGDYSITTKGYIHKTGNTFSDDNGDYMGTATATATANWPNDTRSTFTGAASSNFSRDMDFQLLKITGGTGWIDDSSAYTYRNWFRIECPIDTTLNACDGKSDSLSILGNWVESDFNGVSLGTSAVPDITTTYKVYNGRYMSTIHGETWISSNRGVGSSGFSKGGSLNGLNVESSTGLKFQKLRFKAAGNGILRIKDSRIAELSVYDVVEASYKGLYADDRTTITRQLKGNLSYNAGEGMSAHSSVNVPAMAQNIFGYSYQLSGIEILWYSSLFEVTDTLFKGNAYWGFDLEMASIATFFRDNRAENNWFGVLAASGGTGLSVQTSLMAKGNEIGVAAYHGGVVSLMLGTTSSNIVLKNNYYASKTANGGYCYTPACRQSTMTDNYVTNASDGYALINASKSISTSLDMNSGEIKFYADQSTNRVGGSTADCALVARLYNGTEVEIAILVTDGACP